MLRCLFLLYALMSGAAHAEEPIRLGIFGMVERSDPLVVAGRQIDRPNGLPVISILGTQQSIARGDTLAIVVRASKGRLVAERILQIYPVVGPVREVSGNNAKIMGSLVHIPPNTNVKVGQWLALSGFWSGSKAITSNIRRFDGGVGQLTGVIEPEAETLGGSMVLTEQRPSDGYGEDVWMLSGAPEKEALRVSFLSRGVFGRQVDLAVWQGYASLPIASQTYMIHGSGIVGTALDAQMPEAGALIVKCAHRGRVVDKAPDGFDAAFIALGCAKGIPVD